MIELKKAKEPFQFSARLHLTELTGLKASNLEELLQLIKEVPGSCIYHHTHRFFQEFQPLSLHVPNDFVHWVTNTIGEIALAEELASIDIVQFSSIHALREKIVEVIENYLRRNHPAKLRFSGPDKEFYFAKSVSFIIPTPHVAHDLKEFKEILSQITLDSIYFHIFEARLRLGKSTNDFSNWIETSLDNKALANKISRIDTYSYSLDYLRETIIKIIEREMQI